MSVGEGVFMWLMLVTGLGFVAVIAVAVVAWKVAKLYLTPPQDGTPPRRLPALGGVKKLDTAARPADVLADASEGQLSEQWEQYVAEQRELGRSDEDIAADREIIDLSGAG